MTTKTNAAPSSEDLQDMVSKALRQAWQLGQTYWQQADSDFTSHHRKADETQAKFDALVEEMRATISAAQPPAGWVMGQPITEEMHIAACKILRRANGLDGLPQRMLDAMMAAKAEPAQPHVQIHPENVHVDCDVSRKAEKVDTSADPKAEPVQQPERVPLTEQDLRALHHEDQFGLFCDYDEFEQIARAIEAAHGIQPAHKDQA